MSALLNPIPICAYAPRPEDPDTTNERVVEAELQRLVDAESWDERGDDRAFMRIALRIMGQWWDDGLHWNEALADVQYAETWDDARFLKLMRDGDECAMGRVIRERWLIEFAADVFAAAEEEWNA